MPVFHAHVKAKAFTSDEKKGLADALNLALHESMEAPMDDRFILISEHAEDEFFIHPTFPGMNRTDKRMLVEVTFGTSRTTEQKRRLAELVTRYAVEKTGCSEDDVSLIMHAEPLEHMSFGRGKLVSDIDLSMPWVKR
jgi:phenylpyruvate tautomerase PptA (4-oxalocrotonate tautomerase family)